MSEDATEKQQQKIPVLNSFDILAILTCWVVPLWWRTCQRMRLLP